MSAIGVVFAAIAGIERATQEMAMNVRRSVGFVVAGWLAACGGAAQNQLFGIEDDETTVDAATHDATPDVTSVLEAGSDAWADAAADAALDTAADATLDVKLVDGSIDATVDASSDAVSDAKVDAADAKADVKDSGTVSAYSIWCGFDQASDIYCKGPAETCCGAWPIDGGSPSYACKASAGGCGASLLSMECDGVDDCTGGNVCCFSGNRAGCMTSDKCLGERLCDPLAATTQCTNGYQCKEATWFAGIYVCRKN